MPEYAGVHGAPTIAANRATFTEESPGRCLTLEGARVILSTDPSEERDLTVFRNKTILIIRSGRKATFLASLADATLATPFGAKPTPYDLSTGEYGLVQVSGEGELSSVDTESVAALKMSKGGP